MRQLLLILIGVFALTTTNAQDQEPLNTEYRGEREKVNNLVHTKLKVAFDFPNRYLLGEAWITLEPHFYHVNQLELDAKAMLINKVSMNDKELKYEYDGQKLLIHLGNTFAKGDQYTIYIDYTARPEEVTQQGSAAITSAKGLYFIDPDESDPKKPTQIWTQGETEASSCWFPTIDAPNQKTSQEIYMTVPSKFVTLSNGLLKEQTDNADGTRTDYWKFEKKHAPYLFFMGVGEYSIVEDKWKDLAIDYYVEKEFEPYAMGIFGDTPEMLEFFSEYTGIDYVWSKYAQIVGRDYVSGAMENTTAVIHGEMAYQTDEELADKNGWESVIAHEAFHHWFGDLVTTESWSNLTVNESFANYSEYLWYEHKYGRDHADAHRNSEIKGYMTPENELKDLVRFHYSSREDMFDAVSYNKGGTILHMLRSYLGDEAFKAGMNQYLNDNKYGTGEAHQLRLAFEKVSGKDLNWFFNQWYFSYGHPKLKVEYVYSDQASIVTVNIEQTQDKVFEFPLAIEVYEGDKPKRYEMWVSNKTESFSFKYSQRPDLVNVDADRTLLVEIEDEKTAANYVHMYQFAPKFEDRREGLEGMASNQTDDDVFKTISAALEDPYYGLRIMAIEKIDLSQSGGKKVAKKLEEMARTDKATLVRAAAVKKLSEFDSEKYVELYKSSLNTTSAALKKNSLKALYATEKEAALSFASSINDSLKKESLRSALVPLYIMDKNAEQQAFVASNLIEGMFFTEDKDTQNTYKEGFQWIADSSDEEATQNLVDSFVQLGEQYKEYGADKIAIQVLETVLDRKNGSSHDNKLALASIVQSGLDKLQ